MKRGEISESGNQTQSNYYRLVFLNSSRCGIDCAAVYNRLLRRVVCTEKKVRETLLAFLELFYARCPRTSHSERVIFFLHPPF